MSTIHIEDALDYLILQLAATPEPGPGQAAARAARGQGSDVWIDLLAEVYWSNQGQQIRNLSQDEKEPYVAPFYDAAWDLCRRGILRPGAAIPAGQSAVNQMGARINAAPFFGDGYSLTAMGRAWVKRAVSDRGFMPSDPGRLAEVLLQFEDRFGEGYAQRATEAVSDWRSLNYLSACTMAGAAAESILLATAIAKTRDELKVLTDYRTGSGRARVIKLITAGVTSALRDRFTNALGILSYWRDEAGHGMASTISEIEAHEAISSLLRLAQLTQDHWANLTA